MFFLFCWYIVWYFAVFMDYYCLKMANWGLRTYANIFWRFLELSKCSANLDPWTRIYYQNTQEKSLNHFERYFYISQPFEHTKSKYWKYGTSIFLKLCCNVWTTFSDGSKTIGVCQRLNKNGNLRWWNLDISLKSWNQ